MEFDLLFKAIYEKDEKEINRLTPVVLKVMVSYLRFTFSASEQDAEDCAQDTILKMMEVAQVREDIPENAGGYARQILKNYFLKTYRATTKEVKTEQTDFDSKQKDPYDIFINQELKKILDFCLEKLEEIHRRFMSYILNNPDARAADIGTKFDISESNVWVRRHRIQKQLQECVRKKL